MHDDDRIEALVERHRVVYDAHPALVWRHGERVPVGYDLTLSAVTQIDVHLVPGTRRELRLFETLERIARAALPEPTPSDADRWSIRGFDQSLHVSVASSGRQNVELCVEIRHRDSLQEGLTDADRSFVKDAEARLKALGVRYRRWA